MSYSVLILRPPWHLVGKGKLPNGGPSLKTEDIAADVYGLETEDGTPLFPREERGTFVWVCADSSSHLPRVMRLAEHLRLEYVTQRIWVLCEEVTALVAKLGTLGDSGLWAHERRQVKSVLKKRVFSPERMGPGHYVRTGHRSALLFRKGPTRSHCRSVPSILWAERTDALPLEFYRDALAIAGKRATGAQIYGGQPPPVSGFDHYLGGIGDLT